MHVFTEYPQHGLAALEFTNALWLVGGLAVIFPILAHLLRRRKRRTMTFPAARFIQKARVASDSRRRPVDLLLLLMRCGFVAFLALGFAQPVWKTGKPFALQPSVQPAPEVVLVLDTSASMMRIDSGTSLFEQARQAALSFLQQLEETQIPMAIVVTLSDGPQSILPRMSTNYDELETRLADITPSYGRARLDEAVELARNLPGNNAFEPSGDEVAGDRESGAKSRPERRIIVLTDGQASEWAKNPASETDEQGSDIQMQVFAPTARSSNLALHHPTVSPENALVGEPITIQAELWHDGPSDALPKSVNVRCRIGEIEHSRFVDALVPGEHRLIAFELIFDEAGLFPIIWSVEGSSDAFQFDDHLHDVMQIDAASDVLILHSTTRQNAASEGRLRSIQWLSAAVKPSDDAPFRVRMMQLHANDGDSIESLSTAIEASDSLVVVDVGSMPRSSLRLIDRFVREGGGLLWILDSPESVQSYHEFGSLRRVEDDDLARGRPESFSMPFLPDIWKVGRPSGEDATPPSSMRLPRSAPVRWESGQFPGSIGERAIEMLSLSTFEARSIGRVKPGATVHLEWVDTTSPALLTSRLDRGCVAVFTATVDPAFSDLHRNPAVIPFLHELLRWLRKSGNPFDDSRPGQDLRLSLPSASPPIDRLRVEPEALRWTVVGNPGRAGAHRQQLGTHIERVQKPGFVRVIDRATDQLVALGAVELDPEESLLAQLHSSSDMTAWRSGEPETGVSSRMRSRDLIITRSLGSQPIELWPWMIGFASCFFLFETLTIVLASRGVDNSTRERKVRSKPL